MPVLAIVGANISSFLLVAVDRQGKLPLESANPSRLDRVPGVGSSTLLEVNGRRMGSGIFGKTGKTVRGRKLCHACQP